MHITVHYVSFTVGLPQICLYGSDQLQQSPLIAHWTNSMVYYKTKLFWRDSLHWATEPKSSECQLSSSCFDTDCSKFLRRTLGYTTRKYWYQLNLKFYAKQKLWFILHKTSDYFPPKLFEISGPTCSKLEKSHSAHPWIWANHIM